MIEHPAIVALADEMAADNTSSTWAEVARAAYTAVLRDLMNTSPKSYSAGVKALNEATDVDHVVCAVLRARAVESGVEL